MDSVLLCPILMLKWSMRYDRISILRKEDIWQKDYLTSHNNYFKLTAYRKNYAKHPDGDDKDKYIELDFAYLVDLAVIDMQLRYRIVHMALDVEHHAKLQLLRKVEETGEDGYQIVRDYIDSLGEKQKATFEGEISRNQGNISWFSDTILPLNPLF